MDDPALEGIGGLFLVVATIYLLVLIVAIFFLLTLQKALSRCEPGSRTMAPGQVWLCMVPILNLIWPFFVVNALAESLNREFTRRGIAEEPQPGRTLGLVYASLSVASVVPLVGFLTGLPLMICWILYWKKIAGFSAKIAAPFEAV